MASCALFILGNWWALRCADVEFGSAEVPKDLTGPAFMLGILLSAVPVALDYVVTLSYGVDVGTYFLTARAGLGIDESSRLSTLACGIDMFDVR